MHREDIHKLVIGVGITTVLAFCNYRVGNRLDPQHDQATALLAAAGGLLAALVVLTQTQKWLWRAVAVFVWVGGTGLAYLMLSGKSFGLISYNQLLTRSILRASLDFGSVLLIICLIQFLWERRRGKHQRLFDWFRGGFDA